MTATIDALFTAVRDQPTEDLPRLVWADAVQEWDQQNPATVKCSWCDGDGREAREGGLFSCKLCEGNRYRYILDTRLADRVEFVRVGVELARVVTGQCRSCGKQLDSDRIADGCPCNSPRGINHGIVPTYVCTCDACDPQQTGSVRRRPPDVEFLNTHHNALLSRHRLEWLGGEVCGECGGKKLVKAKCDGMPDLAIDCPRCRGTGWACWPLVQMDDVVTGTPVSLITSHFSRGWVSKIELTWEQLFAAGAAAAIWRHHPVTECVITNTNIFPNGDSNIHSEDILRRYQAKYWRLSDGFLGREAGLKALSEVACEWGREQAKS